MASVHTNPDPTQPIEADKSLGDLLSRLTKDFSSLVSTQVDLAKLEIKEEVSRAGKGAGILTGGAVAAWLAVVLLSFAAAWGLAEVMPTGFAFLIVGAVWLAAAAVLLLRGRNELKSINPVPQQTKAELQEYIQWARQQTS